MTIAIIAITRNGVQLGLKLKEGLSGGELHVLRKFHGSAGKNSLPFDDLKLLFADLWKQSSGIICIMATGIVVRSVAPLLESKDRDPGVVVMDDAGKFAISLLSGHLGGGNELAGRSAFITGAQAVITTATDVNNLPSFDMLAASENWVIDDLSRVKTLNSLLLDEQEIAVVDSRGRVRHYFRGLGKLVFHDTMAAALGSPAKGYLFVTNRRLPPSSIPLSLLILRPLNLVLGIGCNRGTPADEINEFVELHLKRLFLSLKSVACIATADVKRNEAGLLEFAQRHDIPLAFYSSEELDSVCTPSPPSEHVRAAIGAAGVAEPAALLASRGGKLLLKKVKSENVTLAIAETEESA